MSLNTAAQTVDPRIGLGHHTEHLATAQISETLKMDHYLRATEGHLANLKPTLHHSPSLSLGLNDTLKRTCQIWGHVREPIHHNKRLINRILFS